MSNDEVRPKGNSAKAGVVMQTGDPNASISGKKSCAAMSALGRLKIALMPRIETVARRISRSSFKVAGVRMTVNYGLNRVRFPAPVPVGSRLRANYKLLSFERIEGGVQVVTEVTVEREGHPKPVCVAESVARHYL